MTAKTTYYINQLQPDSRKHLDNLKAIGEKCEGIQRRLARSEIRGYLTALNDIRIISDTAFRSLYLYYTSFMNKEV